MVIAGLILAIVASLIHVFIFYMESIAWEGARARATFGAADADELRVTKPLAYNQGFYNLFLALLAIIGAIFVFTGSLEIGAALVFAGTGSMLAAAFVLFLSSPEHRGAAVKQGSVPLLAVVVLALGLLL